MGKCAPHWHLDAVESTCPECSLPVDSYGNTEDQFDFCSFPDCGCDGARLCMAPSGANLASAVMNIEHRSLPMLTTANPEGGDGR